MDKNTEMDDQFTGPFPRYSGAINSVISGSPEDMNEMPASSTRQIRSTIYDGSDLVYQIDEKEASTSKENYMIEQIVDQAKVAPIREILTSALADTAEKFHEVNTEAKLLSSEAQLSLLRASIRAREMIHRRPLTSMLAGIGVGCLMGTIVGMVVGRQPKGEKLYSISSAGELKI